MGEQIVVALFFKYYYLGIELKGLYYPKWLFICHDTPKILQHYFEINIW